MSEQINLSDENCIADLKTVFRDVAEKYPMFMAFLEYYCGYNSAVLSSDPYQISYSGGKRDVILTIKTIMRDDVLPAAIAKQYERILK
jgi:hypothetical protein